MKPPTSEECNAIINTYIGAHDSSTQSHSAFLSFYNGVINSQAFRFAIHKDAPIIDSHRHLQAVVSYIKDSPEKTRQQVEHELFSKSGLNRQELQHVIRIVVRIGFMLDCVRSQESASSTYFAGRRTIICWDPSTAFSDFVRHSFPRRQDGEFPDDIPSVHAWKLVKRCGIKLEKTDDIFEHLLYDRSSKTLRIFHQVTYLRTQLGRYTFPLQELSLDESLKRGTLPPQLLLETLESFYELLFPLIPDKKGRTRRLLKRLIEKNGFDPELFQAGHSRWKPPDFEYVYWADRLVDLGALIKAPPPTNSWMIWLEKHTSERAALMVAIVGLFLSAAVGLLSCVIGAAQLWIAVLAWKEENN